MSEENTSDLREVWVYSDGIIKSLYIPLSKRVLIIAEGGKQGNGGRVVEVKDGWLRPIVWFAGGRTGGVGSFKRIPPQVIDFF